MPEYYDIDRMMPPDELIQRATKHGALVNTSGSAVYYRGRRVARSHDDLARKIYRGDKIGHALNTEFGEMPED